MLNSIVYNVASSFFIHAGQVMYRINNIARESLAE